MFDEIKSGDHHKLPILILSSITILLAACAGYLIVNGLISIENSIRVSAFESAVYLFSSLPPLIVLIYAAKVLSTDKKRFIKAYNKFFGEDVAHCLIQIPHQCKDFININSSSLIHKPTPERQEHWDIYINHISGDFCADYIISSPSTSIPCLYIRIEMNIKRININIGTPVNSESKESNLSSIIPHTSEGASMHPSEKGFYCYNFNKTEIIREIEIKNTSKKFNCVVATLWVPDNFIFKKSERIFFCQDLQLMIRSLYNENDEK